MTKYKSPLFLCISVFLASTFVSSLINTIPSFIIFINIKSDVLRIILSAITGQIILFILLFISMSKCGYEINKTYTKLALFEMSVIIVITVLIITTILSLTLFGFSTYVFINILRYMLPIISMFISYRNGFIKRSKDRERLHK